MAAGDLEKLIDRIEKESAPPDPNSLMEVIRHVAKLFGVKEDEVAIMELVSVGPHAAFRHSRKVASRGIDSRFRATRLWPRARCASGARTSLTISPSPGTPPYSRVCRSGGVLERASKKS